MMFRLHRFTLSCLPLPSWNLQIRLFFDVVFQFRLLSFSLSFFLSLPPAELSLSCQTCPLQNCLCHVKFFDVRQYHLFSLLLHGKEIIMHSVCILCSPVNIPNRCMVFVGNVQNSSSASHLKYLSFDYYYFFFFQVRLSGSSSRRHRHKVKPKDHWSLSLTWVLKIC